jgi:hypothetical protein
MRIILRPAPLAALCMGIHETLIRQIGELRGKIVQHVRLMDHPPGFGSWPFGRSLMDYPPLGNIKANYIGWLSPVKSVMTRIASIGFPSIMALFDGGTPDEILTFGRGVAREIILFRTGGSSVKGPRGHLIPGLPSITWPGGMFARIGMPIWFRDSYAIGPFFGAATTA